MIAETDLVVDRPSLYRDDGASNETEIPLPSSFIRLTEGDTLETGADVWTIITGGGHSPKHVCLYAQVAESSFPKIRYYR
jgi:glyoxylase-like metal-dependent hydrolase (beta-lactamase superfamily II)